MNDEQVRQLTRQNRFTARMMDRGMDFSDAEEAGKRIMEKHDTMRGQETRDRAREVLAVKICEVLSRALTDNCDTYAGQMVAALDAAGLRLVDPAVDRMHCEEQLDICEVRQNQQDAALAAFRAFVQMWDREGTERCMVSHWVSDARAAVEPYMGGE